MCVRERNEGSFRPTLLRTKMFDLTDLLFCSIQSVGEFHGAFSDVRWDVLFAY